MIVITHLELTIMLMAIFEFGAIIDDRPNPTGMRPRGLVSMSIKDNVDAHQIIDLINQFLTKTSSEELLNIVTKHQDIFSILDLVRKYGGVVKGKHLDGESEVIKKFNSYLGNP